jgi:hypothetical protein
VTVDPTVRLRDGAPPNPGVENGSSDVENLEDLSLADHFHAGDSLCEGTLSDMYVGASTRDRDFSVIAPVGAINSTTHPTS